MVILGGEAQAVENLLDAVIEVVGVVVAEQLIRAIVAGGQGLVLGFPPHPTLSPFLGERVG